MKRSKESCAPRTLARLIALGAGLSAFACGSVDEQTEGDLDTTTAIAALEANEDASEELVADAIDEAPLLFKGCRQGQLRAQLGERPEAREEEGAMRRVRREFADVAERVRSHAGRPGSSARSAFGEGLAEQGQLPRAVRARLLREIYDADASGDLDQVERELLRADLEARCTSRMSALLEKFDSDGSGDLNDEEWAAAHAAIHSRFSALRSAIVAEFDRDGDGTLSPAERETARSSVAERISTRIAALVLEFDADGDGVLNDAEHQALVELVRAVVRGEVSVAEFSRL